MVNVQVNVETSWERTVRRVTLPRLSALVAGLRRGEHLVVERAGQERPGHWYVQVLAREDGTFQLEYRDGVPAEHYETRTVSREKVAEAMAGWANGDPAWKDPFQWRNIGSMFADDLGSPSGLPGSVQDGLQDGPRSDLPDCRPTA